MKSFVFLLLAVALVSCASRPVSVAEAFGAVDANDVGILRRYLDGGGDPNALAKNGASMLYVATGPHGGEGVLRLLLERGADPNRGSGLYTPLMNAASWCWRDGTRLLLDAGADIHRKNEDGKTALETVCSGGTEREVVAYLRARGA